MAIILNGTTGIDMGNTPVSNIVNGDNNDAVNKDYAVGKVISTDNAIVRFDGTAGDVQNSLLNIYDSGNVELLNPSLEPGENKITISRPNVTGNYAYMSLLSNGSGSGNQKVRIGSSSTYMLSLETGNVGKAEIDIQGNLLLVSGTGTLGYGAGAGGTVTQLTSKSTAVTLNKPSGRITTHNAALAAGASVVFRVNNNIVISNNQLVLISPNGNSTNYRIEVVHVIAGYFDIRITNISGGSLSESIVVSYGLFWGATA